LDLVRFMAALTVLLFHASDLHFGGAWYPSFEAGPDAVIIFFVLSGFVIAHVAQAKELQVTEYAASRLSRLWSVALPALALTVAADFVGTRLSPSLYADPEYHAGDHALWRVVSSALFMNQIWFWDIRPLSDWPFWSLGYEFWYYALFGAIYYFRGPERAIGAGLTVAIAGPKIMLLAPVWLLGAAAHALTKKKIASVTAWGLFVAPPIIYVIAKTIELPLRIKWHVVEILRPEFAKLFLFPQFPWFYALGLLVAAHFIGLLAVQNRFDAISRAERPIRWLASCTLSLYLCHAPLLMLGAAILRPSQSDPAKSLAIIGFALAGCFTFGRFIEPQRHSLRQAVIRFSSATARLASQPNR